MIINSIRFENYRAYYGEADFKFPIEGDKNISIIYANNDVGKSCFFSGVQFCLYGEKDATNLMDLININAQEEKTYCASVSIFAESDGHSIEITRSIEPRGSVRETPNNRDFKETLNIFKDGVPLTADNEEKADFINSLVHEDASQYFFFDGERINDYSTASGGQYKEAIARILGIKEIENAIEDMNLITQELERERDEYLQRQERYNDTLLKKNGISDKVQAITKEIAAFEDEISAAREGIQRKEDELKKYEDIREKVERKQKLTEEMEDLKAKLEEIRAKQSECIKNNATLILAANIYAKMAKGVAESAPSYYITSDVKEHLLRLIKQPVCVCGTPIDENRIQASREYIDQNFIENDDLAIEKEREKLFRACEEYRDHGIRAREDYLACCTEILKLEETKISLQRQLTELRKHIGSYQEEAGVRISEEITRFEERMEESKLRKERDTVLLEQARAQLSALEKELAEQSQLDDEGKLCQKKLEMAQQLVDVFVEYKDKLLEEKRSAVERFATEVFRSITNAPQKYQGIKIDSDYSLLLELTNGETYHIEPGRTLNPSTGQSKVISLSYIAGLNRSSNYVAPVIIDNPLGLFSEEHRIAIARYLPHFSRQVIFMVSSGDLTDKYRDVLLPYIKTEYYLANESTGTWSKTTIASKEDL